MSGHGISPVDTPDDSSVLHKSSVLHLYDGSGGELTVEVKKHKNSQATVFTADGFSFKNNSVDGFSIHSDVSSVTDVVKTLLAEDSTLKALPTKVEAELGTVVDLGEEAREEISEDIGEEKTKSLEARAELWGVSGSKETRMKEVNTYVREKRNELIVNTDILRVKADELSSANRKGIEEKKVELVSDTNTLTSEETSRSYEAREEISSDISEEKSRSSKDRAELKIEHKESKAVRLSTLSEMNTNFTKYRDTAVEERQKLSAVVTGIMNMASNDPSSFYDMVVEYEGVDTIVKEDIEENKVYLGNLVSRVAATEARLNLLLRIDPGLGYPQMGTTKQRFYHDLTEYEEAYKNFTDLAEDVKQTMFMMGADKDFVKIDLLSVEVVDGDRVYKWAHSDSYNSASLLKHIKYQKSSSERHGGYYYIEPKRHVSTLIFPTDKPFDEEKMNRLSFTGGPNTRRLLDAWTFSSDGQHARVQGDH